MSAPWKFLLSTSCDIPDQDVPNWFRVMVSQELAAKLLRRMKLFTEISKVDNTLLEIVFSDTGPESSGGRFYFELDDHENEVKGIDDWASVAGVKIHVDDEMVHWSGYHEESGMRMTSDGIYVGQIKQMAAGRSPDYVDQEAEEDEGDLQT